VIITNDESSGRTRIGVFFLVAILSTLFIPGVSGHDTPNVIDGVIAPDEYEHTYVAGDGAFELSWTEDHGLITMAMSARTDGWVSVGFDPVKVMKDADMVFGWVDDSGVPHVVDCFSEGTFGPHPEDTELGGTSDIISFAVSYTNGKTIVEFRREVNASDPYDRSIDLLNETDIIWAIGPSDDFNAKHSRAGYATVHFGTGEASGGEILPVWVYHALLMVAGTSLMTLGFIIVRFLRKRRWWLKRHKGLGHTAAGLSIIGFLAGFIMVSLGSGVHFRVPHTWLGGITLILGISTPILCRYQMKVKAWRKQLRNLHRWTGRFAVLMMLVTTATGFSQVGLFTEDPGGRARYPSEYSPFTPLFRFFVLASIVVALFVYIWLIVAVKRYREKKGDKEPEDRIQPGVFPAPRGDLRLETAWTIVPLIIVLFLTYISLAPMDEIWDTPEDATVIQVQGYKWEWRFVYPNGTVSYGEVVIDCDQPVLFEITSLDVVHSFFLPEFGVKEDAVPGQLTELWIDPIEPGEYRIVCAEYCGLQHANMEGRLIIRDNCSPGGGGT